MKVLVYLGPQKALRECSKTEIAAPTAAIVKGNVPSCAPGRILGHEVVGVIESVGQGAQ